MRRIAAATTLLLAAWFAVWLVPGAEADAPEATGWWSAHRITPISQAIPQPADVVPDTVPRRDQHGGTPIPQPPYVSDWPSTSPSLQTFATVPPGGLYVAGYHVRVDGSQVPLEAIPDRTPTDRRLPFPTPSAETPREVPQEAPDVETQQTVAGMSALRLFVGEDAAVGNLTLDFAEVQSDDGRELPKDNKLGTVAIQACVPEYFWTPDEGGPIESAPKPNCAEGLAYGEDTGPTVKFPVGGLVRNGMLDVVLMPQQGSAFHAVFEKPGPDSLEVTRYPSTEEGGGSGGGGGGAFSFDVPFVPDVACDCPLGEVPVLASTGTFDPAVVFTDVQPSAPSVPVSGPSRQLFGDDGGRLISEDVPQLTTWQKAMAGGILALLMAFYLLLLRPPGALPLLAVGRRRSEDAEATRGIGRFARPRTGPNPRL